MSNRSIEAVIAPPNPHFVGDGFRVHNFIPGNPRLSMERMSPFIMLDYNSNFVFPPSESPKGVGVHPHRGFETVTIAYKGKVAHQDSAGNSGVIGEGEVQWMTAASGILHKEYHEENFSKAGGEFQMVQLWVNLPSKDKMSKPKYQGISKDQIQIVSLENNQGQIELIAGQYQGVEGPAFTFTPINMFNAKLNAGAKASFSFQKHHNTALLVVEGEIKVNKDTLVKLDHLVLMANDGEDFEIAALKEATILIISGEAINEPIAAHGPFVMNTQREIIEAFNDYQAGKFGELTD
jgi:quercetin 2,3-dioxygenase